MDTTRDLMFEKLMDELKAIKQKLEKIDRKLEAMDYRLSQVKAS